PTGYLNVRTKPSVIGGEVIGRVQPGQTYEYTKEEDDWYYIEISQEEKGWVFSQYVEEIETIQPVNEEGNSPAGGEETSAVLKTPKVRILQTPTGYLNVRNTSSLSGTRIGRVQPTEVYEYTDKENDWYQIIFGDDEKGWVSGEYIEEL
ncbi:SH3 domain-containing protein, partial [Patescibacteria group bacterium]|nr:SH3 domain-containing protein [Patescibacteria group bacterium]